MFVILAFINNINNVVYKQQVETLYMDENIIISMILHGCELAQTLEANLPSMLNHSNALSESCGEIIKAFMAVQENLSGQHASLFSQQFPVFSQEMGREALSVEEWLTFGCSQGMDRRTMMESHEHDLPARISLEHNQEAGGGVADAGIGTSISKGVRGSGNFQTGQTSGSNRPESSTRSRRRSDRRERDGRRTVRMAAPRIGNTEIPPEDGFTWRKYGQKEILGSRFPRAYFRCTHQKLYNCPAKKLVQRLDDDPDTFEVTYRNDHTCHMSSTAPGPSTLIRPLLMHNDFTTTAPVANSFVPATSQQHSTTWLSMGIGGLMPTMDPRGLSYGGLLMGDAGGYNHQPVMDMADAMFNSGSSSNTSMDQIFSSITEDKWDQGGDVNGKKQC